MRKSLLFFICFLAGTIFGFLIHSKYSGPRGIIVRQSGYELISPILACEIGDKDTFTELKPIKDAIKQSVDKSISSAAASSISVYFRLMNTGRWTGVNEDTAYAPASLLKVLAMVGYFKTAESDPSILEKTLVYNGAKYSKEINQNSYLINGKFYTVSELIDIMIKKSSNGALYLLLDNATPAVAEAIKALHSDLNLPAEPNLNSEKDFISPRTYSMIFRVLYGGTYLDRNMSEKALSILSKTEFNNGLVDNLSKDTTVAHKFGVASIPEGNTKVQELHDCGIVYFPKHPYLLCVMTKGSDPQILAKSVADVSLAVYKSVGKFFQTQ